MDDIDCLDRYDDFGRLAGLNDLGMFDGPLVEITVWGKLLMTLSLLLATSVTILLSLLVASRVRK